MRPTKYLAILLIALSGRSLADPVDIWISSMNDRSYYEAMIALYRATVDEDFEAEIHSFGFREMPDKLAVAIKAGQNTPDVVQLDEVFFGLYLRDDMPFLDLTDRIHDSGMDKDVLPRRLSLFSKDDRIFGLPQSISATVLYYRRDLFEKYGVSPYELETWEDVVRVGETLVARGQSFLSLDPSYFEILLRQRGGRLFGEDGKAFPEFELAVETLQWLVDISNNKIGLMPDRSTIFDPIFFSSDVSNNEAMAIIGADWYGLDMIQQFSQDLEGKWGILEMPVWREVEEGKRRLRTSTFAGQGLLIYKDSPQIEESWKFIEWVMTDREANVNRFLLGNSFPAYRPVYDDARLTQPHPFFGGDNMGKMLISIAEDVPEVAMSPNRPQAVFLIREGLISSVMYGQSTAREAIGKLKAQLDGEE